MSDRIRIRGLEVFANHGVYEEETKLGQKFLVDVSLHLDTRKAGFSDDIHDSVDYGSVCHFITKTRRERSSLKNKRSTGKDKRASDQNERVCG